MFLDAVDLGAENDARLARLREALVLGEGFQLLVVQVEPGEQRDEVLRRLSGWSGRHGVPTLELVRLAPGESPMTRLGSHGGVVLVGLEVEPDSPAQRFREVIAELNWSRDQLPEKVRGPLVLVVSQRVQTSLFEQAPDFYSWRSHTTNIAGVPSPEIPYPLRDVFGEPEDPTTLGELLEEACSLQPIPRQEVGRLHRRIARAWLMRGNLLSAEAAVDAAKTAYGDTPSLDERLELLLLRKEIAASRGQMDKASTWLELAQQEAAAGTPSAYAAASLSFEVASLALARGDEASAVAPLLDAINVVQSLGDHRAEAALLQLRASLEPAGVARSTPERALESARRAGDPVVEVNVLIDLAHDASVGRRSDDAEQYAHDAVALASVSSSADARAAAGATLGEIALDNGHLSLAREVLSATLRPERVYLAGDVATARGRLALIERDDARAELYFLEALEAYRRYDPEQRTATLSLALGDVAARNGNRMLALTAFETADRMGDRSVRAIAAFELALLTFDAGERTETLAEQFCTAAQLLVAAGRATLGDLARTCRAMVLQALGRLEDARRELETAYTGFDDRGQAELGAYVEGLLLGAGRSQTNR